MSLNLPFAIFKFRHIIPLFPSCTYLFLYSPIHSSKFTCAYIRILTAIYSIICLFIHRYKCTSSYVLSFYLFIDFSSRLIIHLFSHLFFHSRTYFLVLFLPYFIYFLTYFVYSFPHIFRHIIYSYISSIYLQERIVSGGLLNLSWSPYPTALPSKTNWRE